MTQEQTLKILKSGANVFLTGEPGSGKSHTINQYVAWLREHGIYPAVTASTGIAATHINGRTLHSWCGIGIKRNLDDTTIEEIMDKPWIYDSVRNTKVLIIDEVSMLDSVTVDDAERVVSRIKAQFMDGAAFGGMQVIFVGDLFQLPPVPARGEGAPKFFYESKAYESARPVICYLHEQHRQEDPKFLATLTAMRSGKMEKVHHDTLKPQKPVKEQGFATKLYSHNKDVNGINDGELLRLQGDMKKYVMSSFGIPYLVETIKKSCLSPEVLKLKVGALVMFTKNDFEAGFVNGTLGEIVEFLPGNTPVVKVKGDKLIRAKVADWAIYEGKEVIASVSQIPLRLAWAMTVHKSQGMSLDRAIIDLSKAFEYGQGYVALSRVRSLAGLSLLGINQRAMEMHPEIIKHDVSLREQSAEMDKKFAALPTDRTDAMAQEFIRKIKS